MSRDHPPAFDIHHWPATSPAIACSEPILGWNNVFKYLVGDTQLFPEIAVTTLRNMSTTWKMAWITIQTKQSFITVPCQPPRHEVDFVNCQSTPTRQCQRVIDSLTTRILQLKQRDASMAPPEITTKSRTKPLPLAFPNLMTPPNCPSSCPNDTRYITPGGIHSNSAL